MWIRKDTYLRGKIIFWLKLALHKSVFNIGIEKYSEYCFLDFSKIYTFKNLLRLQGRVGSLQTSDSRSYCIDEHEISKWSFLAYVEEEWKTEIKKKRKSALLKKICNFISSIQKHLTQSAYALSSQKKCNILFSANEFAALYAVSDSVCLH